MQANKFRPLGLVETMALAVLRLELHMRDGLRLPFCFAYRRDAAVTLNCSCFSNHRRAERQLYRLRTRRARRVARLYMHGVASSFPIGSSFCTSCR